MNRGAVNRVTQVGIEATAGTTVAATKFTPTLSWMLKRERNTKTFRARGSKVPSTHVLHKTMSKGSVEGSLDYNSCMYIFNSLFNYDAGTLSSGAYLRSWTPGVRTADSTGKTFTIEDGDATACEDYTYTKVISFELSASQDDFGVKGNLLARYPDDGQTLASLSGSAVVAERPIERKQVNLYIDSVYGSLGSTLITEALNETITIPDKFKEFFVHNRTAGEFYDIVEIPYEPSFKFSTVHNAQSRTLIASLTTNPYRWIRWEALGNVVGASQEMLRFDMCCKFDTPEVVDGDDGPLGYDYNCTMMPDDTGLGSYMKITNVNALSAM
ncbi:hypothetical protein BH10ACI2_BH10ACI2_04330 [soil metagenome]